MKHSRLTESGHGTGAIRTNSVRRKLRRTFGERVGRAPIPFDWAKGYDSLDQLGGISIKNQGESSSCGGQAGAYLLEILRGLKGHRDTVSAKSIYSITAYPGGGTTVNAIETQIGGNGANLESSVPSYRNGEPPTEAFMTDRDWQSRALTAEALDRAGYTPMSVDIGMEEIACAVRDHKAVIIEITGQNNGSWLSRYPQPPTKANPNPRWYHFMCITGARTVDGQRQLNALQSWGEEAGENGRQYFREAYVSPKFILDAFAFIPDSEIVPDDSNVTVWAEIWRWFRRMGLGNGPRPEGCPRTP